MTRNIVDNFLFRTALLVTGGAFTIYLVISALRAMAMHAMSL